jgi:hypothetical protein
VGGTSAGARNILSANSIGVQITDPGTSGNRVLGNFIGTDFTGTRALGNHTDGFLLHNGASQNTIGGTSAAAGNTIAFNLKGVVLVDKTIGGDSILGNRIFGNASLGIDLGDNGPTPNSSKARPLPNSGQNFPVLTALSATTVSGSLQGTPRTSYRLEFFASPASGPAFQGKAFLGFKLVSTNASGLAVFTARVTPIARGQVVTATATNLKTGDTSEFSPGRQVTSVRVTSKPTIRSSQTPQSVKLSAVVSSNGVPVTAGLVTFTIRGLTGSVTVAVGKNGVALASFLVRGGTRPGRHAIIAVYHGSGKWAGASSDPVADGLLTVS